MKDGKTVGMLVLAALAIRAFTRKPEVPEPEVPPPALVPANIYGRVLDAETSAPLGEVEVSLWSPDGAELLASTSTNSSGNYRIENILPGFYTITLEKEGYIKLTDSGEIAPGNNELPDYVLSPVAPTPLVDRFIEWAVDFYHTDVVTAMGIAAGDWGLKNQYYRNAGELLWHSLQGRDGYRQQEAEANLQTAINLSGWPPA
jgi:hypothetical protein